MRTLPPEQEDLSCLVDDEDQFGFFIHVYQADSQAPKAGLRVGMSGNG